LGKVKQIQRAECDALREGSVSGFAMPQLNACLWKTVVKDNESAYIRNQIADLIIIHIHHQMRIIYIKS
jgi:hypothetical protein